MLEAGGRARGSFLIRGTRIQDSWFWILKTVTSPEPRSYALRRESSRRSTPDQDPMTLHRKKTIGALDSGNRSLFTPLHELSAVRKRGNRRSQIMTTAFRTYLRVSGFFLIALSLACLSSPARELRKDTIVMSNGDRITGQVKRLQNGLLFVEMPYVSGMSQWFGRSPLDSNPARHCPTHKASRRTIVRFADVLLAR